MKTNWPAFRFSCLLLAGAALAVVPVGAQVSSGAATAIPARAASISNVEVTAAGQRIAVRISGNQELHYHTSRLDNPPRLVLDFPDTLLKAPTNRVSSEYAPVREVRLGEPTPGKSRVVIDLAAFAPYSVEANGSNLTVSFDAQSASSAAAVLAPIRPAKAVGRKQIAVKAPNMPLPAWMTGQNLTFASPKNDPPPPPAPIPQNQTLQASATQTPAAVSRDQKYTGDPISVDLKDVDLKDFFRLIHEISGLNVVLDPSVKGTVTLVLDDVPWDQALDIVLRNNALTKQIDGNVLRIATQDTLKHEAEQQRDLAKAQSDAIDTVTTTRVLSYAKADALTVTLKRFLSPRGDIIADARSNTLIIRDIPSNLPKIIDLVQQLDRKSQQVEIDARVVEASRSFARDIGTQLAYSFGAGNNVFGGNAAVGTSPISRTVTPPFSSPAYIVGSSPLTAGTPTAVQMPLATNLAAGAATSGLSYIFSSPNFALDFVLSAMETKGVGKVLSEPKGVTQNNQKLTVKQGTEIPIQTTVNNTVSVQFEDVVLKLEVTPQITAEGTVFLDITVENTSIDTGIAAINGIPALDTQSTETKVLINDGGTVVIGGVVITSTTTNINEVPLVGSIPLIGNLFKETKVNVSSQELLFFVTPRILPG